MKKSKVVYVAFFWRFSCRWRILTPHSIRLSLIRNSRVAVFRVVSLVAFTPWKASMESAPGNQTFVAPSSTDNRSKLNNNPSPLDDMLLVNEVQLPLNRRSGKLWKLFQPGWIIFYSRNVVHAQKPMFLHWTLKKGYQNLPVTVMNAPSTAC